jgi:L-asparaginase
MKILFIQTGGTIDKDYPRLTKGYAFEITEPAVRRILGKIQPVFENEISTLMQKDSLDITDEDRAKLLTACRNADEEKIIITHGTDTMIETARYLAVIKDKVIILTGAMRPERFSDSDADFNIGVAVGAVQTLSNGIYVVMNGMVYPADKVKRDLNTGRFVDI